jgi:hypothetical protein
MSGDMREDVESWDVNVVRAWPYFTTAGKPYEQIVPHVQVNIGVRFVTDEAAREFEARVRGLLQS